MLFLLLSDCLLRRCPLLPLTISTLFTLETLGILFFFCHLSVRYKCLRGRHAKQIGPKGVGVLFFRCFTRFPPPLPSARPLLLQTASTQFTLETLGMLVVLFSLSVRYKCLPGAAQCSFCRRGPGHLILLGEWARYTQVWFWFDLVWC